MSTKSASGTVKVGDAAPDFTLPAQGGNTVRLRDFLGKSAIVLYFYPRDETAGCTAEACSFRDHYEVFKETGTEVIGVSSDSEDSHKRFAARHKLPFILVSDKDGELRKSYGVPTTFGLLPGRVTYIIDKQGIVRHIFSSQFMPQKHIDEALKTLHALNEA
jgi:thioredoxin-dependent peroxiredoxin